MQLPVSVDYLSFKKYKQYSISIETEISIIVVHYAKDLAMKGPMSIQYEVMVTKCFLPSTICNRLLQVIGGRAHRNSVPRILTALLLFIMAFYVALSYSDAFAQHMMMPPSASVGDRKITLNFHAEPTNIISNQTVLTKLAFTDQNTKQTVKHVTVRMEISDSDSGRRLLSEFFHAHNGNIDINFKPSAGLKYVMTGNMDDLTNAWVADPGSPIIVNGPIFSEPGKYRIILEVTTIDNDKTDLPQPLNYDLIIPVS